MHGWRLHPQGRIPLLFKTMKNIKIADPVLPTKSFYDKDDILQKKKLRHHSESKIWKHFSPATMAGYQKLNGFFCAFHYFCITCC